jgi:hypothetical protein
MSPDISPLTIMDIRGRISNGESAEVIVDDLIKSAQQNPTEYKTIISAAKEVPEIGWEATNRGVTIKLDLKAGTGVVSTSKFAIRQPFQPK